MKPLHAFVLLNNQFRQNAFSFYALFMSRMKTQAILTVNQTKYEHRNTCIHQINTLYSKHTK